MSPTFVQQLFVSLSKSYKNQPIKKNLRRKLRSHSITVKTSKNIKFKGIKVQIINAVTGEATTAVSYESSVKKLKKWLKMRNLRAQFSNFMIKKKSAFSKLSLTQFIDYPIIVKIGNFKAPYLIDYISEPYKYGKKTVCFLYLKVVGNVEYLQIIHEKVSILEELKKKK